jgi:hypothetical protein
MPDVGFGGTAASGGFLSSAGYVYTGSIGLPTGRAMANGSTACLITALHGYIAGRSAARNVTMALGSSSVNFNVGSAGSAVATGWLGSSNWLVNGGTAAFRYDVNGGFYFARSSTSGAQGVIGSFGNFTGYLGGAYRYVQAPAALAVPTLSTGPGQLIVDFSGSPDDGGSGVTGYTIHYTTDPTFSTGITVVTTTSGHNVIAVTPGQVYYVRVACSNAVTAAAGTLSAWSPAASIRVGIGGKRWSGTAEVPFTTAVRWDGTTEVPITIAMRWDGTAEVPIAA